MEFPIMLGKIEKRKYEDREYATISAIAQSGDVVKTSIYDQDVYIPALKEFEKRGSCSACLILSPYAKSDGKLGVRIDDVVFE